MKVINLWGGPGSGKSTSAAGLFYLMKSEGISVELVTEVPKDYVWEKRFETLKDQLYVTAKQNHRLERLRGQVDWVITDSPLLMGIAYCDPNYLNGAYKKMIEELWNTYDNESFFINRTKEYATFGRNQTLSEAIEIDEKLREIVQKYHVGFSHEIDGDIGAPQKIFEFITENFLK